MGSTVTFEFIRKIQLEEQKSSQLAKLPEDFYEAVASYLEKKRSTSSERRDLLEIRNIERLIKNIFERRERKLLNAAIIKVRAGVDPVNLTKEEKDFFDKIVQLLKKRRELVLEPLLSPKRKEEDVLVVFKQDVPAFVGGDGKTYGPFKKGDIARLPEENRKILLDQGIVEEFKIEK